MSLDCLNCGSQISGEGKNKIFCDSCLRRIAPFLKFISTSDQRAIALFSVNKEKLADMNLSEDTLAYIKKCCVRYDEKRFGADAVVPDDEQGHRGYGLYRQKTSKYDKSKYAATAGGIQGGIQGSTANTDENQNDTADNAQSDIQDDDNTNRNRLILIISAAVLTFMVFIGLYFSGIIPGFKSNIKPDPPAQTDIINPADTGDTGDTVESDKPIDTEDTEPADTEPADTQGTEECQHTQWADATCTEPGKCMICGKTEGEPLGHDWTEATCTEPKTCTRCRTKEGDALGHSFSNATCDTPETCTRCGATNGKALGHTWVYNEVTGENVCSVCKRTEHEVNGTTPHQHTWVAATCTTPEHCTGCNETKGDALGHKWIEATCTTPKICSVCGVIEGSAQGHTWIDATCTTPRTCSVCHATEGSPAGHTVDGIMCTVCGKYAVTIFEQNETYVDISGLSVTVMDISSEQSNGKTIYTVSYLIVNGTSDSISEGSFKLFLTGGGGVDQLGASVTLAPDNSVQRTITFELPAGSEPLVLEYYYDGGDLITRTTPHLSSDALYWLVK